MDNSEDLSVSLLTLQRRISDTLQLVTQATSAADHALAALYQPLHQAHTALEAAQAQVSAVPASRVSVARPPQPEARTASEPRQPDQPVERIHCPVCYNLFPRGALKRHLKEAHVAPPRQQAVAPAQKQRPKAPHTTPTQPSALRPNTLMICPVCSAAVRNDRLENHMQRVHGQALGQPVTPARERKATGRRSVRTTSLSYTRVSDIKQDTRLAALDGRDRLDGGKLYSESRRDRGRFGSSPLHDDYSEDSSA